MTHIRTLIAAERTLFRQGLAALVGADSRFVVVADAANSDETRHAAEREAPDLIVLDSDLPHAEGECEIISCVRAACPAAAIVVLGEADRSAISDTAAEAALRAERARVLACGADAYLPARADGSELLRVLTVAATARARPDADTTLETPHPPGRNGARHRITDRERAIIAMIAQGLCNKEVAHRLGISTQTVKNHVHHLLEKFSLADRTQIAVYAIEHRFEF